MVRNFLIKSVVLIKFPIFEEDNGEISVFEQNFDAIPFLIKRIFNVRSEKNSIRGKHAHRLCSQLLICSNGSIEVICDDSFDQKVFILDRPNLGLLIPPGIWAEQKYLQHNSSMTVVCDRLYESEDYISDYDKFKEFVYQLNQKETN
jgi:dTDP-4-dehydrorhamnose 3,5-epimerase-like enzyme